MRTTTLLIVLGTAALAFGMTPVKAAKPASDVSVTTSPADYDAVGQPYSVQSDGGGAYRNGVGGVVSILLANGYNGITWGDWRVDLLANPTSRTVGISFCDPARGTACPRNARLKVAFDTVGPNGERIQWAVRSNPRDYYPSDHISVFRSSLTIWEVFATEAERAMLVSTCCRQRGYTNEAFTRCRSGST